MTLQEVLKDIYSLTFSDLIPLSTIQTEDDKTSQKSGYIVMFTEAEWQEKYPGISPACVYYAPVLSCSPMVYFNAESYVWVNLPIFPCHGNDSPFDSANSIYEVLQDAENMAQEGDWGKLIFRMPHSIQMFVLNELMNRAGSENEKEKIYGLFKDYYPLGDFFTSMLPDDFAKKFMEGKSAAQKEETRKAMEHIKGETIRVYRGAANKSAGPEKALSWTEDINIAYLFALKAGICPKIYVGEVEKKDVLEYFDGSEKEVTVIPGSVKVERIDVLYEYDSPEIMRAAQSVAPIFSKTKAEIEKLYGKKARKCGENEEHGCEHSIRVLAFALILGQLEGLSGTQLRKLAQAAAFHDIGRCDDGPDCSHGERSEKIYKTEKGFRRDASVAFLIRCHCVPDSEAQSIARCEQDKKLLWILKDADALDRFRFGWIGRGKDTLDASQLRIKNSKLFVNMAHKMQRDSF